MAVGQNFPHLRAYERNFRCNALHTNELAQMIRVQRPRCSVAFSKAALVANMKNGAFLNFGRETRVNLVNSLTKQTTASPMESAEPVHTYMIQGCLKCSMKVHRPCHQIVRKLLVKGTDIVQVNDKPGSIFL